MPPDTTWSLSSSSGGATSSGSASGIRHSRTQGLLCAPGPAGGRPFVLVNGLEAWVDHAAGRSHLATQRYAPGTNNPDEPDRLLSFTTQPWPSWRFRADGGAHVSQEVQLVPGRALVALRWSLFENLHGFSLGFRPFISGRDPEALHHHNDALRESSEKRGWKVTWRPYDGVPEISAYSNAAFEPDPHWYHNFVFDDGTTEDLFSPGVFRAPLKYGTPVELILAAGWDQVVEGMILPEQPVLWAEAGKPEVVRKKVAARKPVTKKKAVKKKVAPKKKAGKRTLAKKKVVKKSPQKKKVRRGKKGIRG